MRRLLALALCALPALARATPHALPYSYPYATLPQDGLEVEQYVDLTPVRAFDLAGNLTTAPRGVLTTELEYGVLDRLELGLYLQLSDDPGSATGAAPLRLDGVKQRLRLRLAEAGAWPVDVSLYLELAELREELELEAKLNLERRFGPVQVLVNLWAEREFYYQGRQEWVLNPTAGATLQLTPAVHLGLEYWMHGELGGGAPATAFNPAFHHFLGPALMVQGGRFWWAVAPYLRLDAWAREGQLGDQFGRVWVRSIVGVDL